MGASPLNEKLLYKSISERAIRAIKISRQNYTEIAIKLDISPQRLSQYLSCTHKFPLTFLVRLEKILNLTPGYFIYG